MTNLTNFYDKVTALVDTEKKPKWITKTAFDTVSHKILVDKLLMYRLVKPTGR